MKFGNFQLMVYMIWLVPVLVVFYVWSWRRKKTLMERFAQKELLPGIVPFYEKDPRGVRLCLNIAVVLLIILALARPQWGFYWKEDTRKGLDVVVAIDVSKSMLATDIQPDRLSFCKAELKDFVKKLKGDRVGLIAFAGEAFLQCPLTTDYSGFLLALKDLNVDTIPKGGTSMPNAIEEAIRSYRGAETRYKVLIMITDGENTEGDVRKAVAKATKEGIMISCIGIGTTKGEVIAFRDEKGQKTYVKNEAGELVKSRLMEDTLEMIAKKTGGIYVRASQAHFGLRQIYQERLLKLEKKKTEEKKVKVYKERFQFPLALAFLLLIIELVLRGKSGSKPGL